MIAAARGRGDRPTRVYYHHLMKCGGITLKRWLDEQTSDARPLDPDEMALDALDLVAPARLRAMGIAASYWSDVIHTHVAIGGHVAPDTFRFTVLRDPVRRLVSQVSDWRRLEASALAGLELELRACVADAATMRLKPFLQLHARGAGRQWLDNYMVRAIATTRLGPATEAIADARNLLALAREALAADYELVGVTDQGVRTRQALCRRMGWAPAPDVLTLNATRSATMLREEAEEAAEILAEHTAYDAILYADALTRLAAEPDGYDAAEFEANHASRRAGGLRGRWSDGRTVFSVHDALIGNGWYGRDGAGMADCAVWTGPGQEAVLYMPVPAGQQITVYVWVRGYAVAEQRDALSLRIDGRPAPHRFELQDGYQDVVAAQAATTRDFIRLEISCGDAAVTGAPGEPDYDERPRGLAFDRYGWAVA